VNLRNTRRNVALNENLLVKLLSERKVVRTSALATIAKNEQPSVAEWIAYHRPIGLNHIPRLEAAGVYEHWPDQIGQPQQLGSDHFTREVYFRMFSSILRLALNLHTEYSSTVLVP